MQVFRGPRDQLVQQAKQPRGPSRHPGRSGPSRSRRRRGPSRFARYTETFGLSELFVEGAEPPLSVQPKDEFLARFPAGEYMIVGETADGRPLLSKTVFTHDIPDGPVMISPGADGSVDLDAPVISWEPVTSPVGIEIVRYELFVSAEDDEVLGIEMLFELPATVTEVPIPSALMMAGTYKYEVLAIETSGNKTITEGEFTTGGFSASSASEGVEEEYLGIVASFSSTELVFEDGTTFVIDDNTDVETTLKIGL